MNSQQIDARYLSPRMTFIGDHGLWLEAVRSRQIGVKDTQIGCTELLCRELGGEVLFYVTYLHGERVWIS